MKNKYWIYFCFVEKKLIGIGKLLLIYYYCREDMIVMFFCNVIYEYDYYSIIDDLVR